MIDVTVLDLLGITSDGFTDGKRPTEARAAAAALLLLLQGREVSKTNVMAYMGLPEDSVWLYRSKHPERWATVLAVCDWHKRITGVADVTTATRNDLNTANNTIGELRATIKALEAQLAVNDEVLAQLLDVARGPLNNAATHHHRAVTPDDNVTGIRHDFFYEDDGTSPPPARTPHLRPVPDIDQSHTPDPDDDGSFAIWDAEEQDDTDEEEF